MREEFLLPTFWVLLIPRITFPGNLWASISQSPARPHHCFGLYNRCLTKSRPGWPTPSPTPCPDLTRTERPPGRLVSLRSYRLAVFHPKSSHSMRSRVPSALGKCTSGKMAAPKVLLSNRARAPPSSRFCPKHEGNTTCSTLASTRLGL